MRGGFCWGGVCSCVGGLGAGLSLCRCVFVCTRLLVLQEDLLQPNVNHVRMEEAAAAADSASVSVCVCVCVCVCV